MTGENEPHVSIASRDSGRLGVTPVRTPIFGLGGDLIAFVTESLGGPLAARAALNGRILAVTSKLLSLAENGIVPKASISKADLIRREADQVLGESEFRGESGQRVLLTLKQGLYMAAAGIDESNVASPRDSNVESSAGAYLTLPKDLDRSTRALHAGLKQSLQLQSFGLIVTDSRTTPLRRGVTGVALSSAGFYPTRSLIGRPDLFGRALKMTSINVVDALAVAAVYAMGEADEQTPLAILDGHGAEFSTVSAPDDPADVRIAPKDDLFRLR